MQREYIQQQLVLGTPSWDGFLSTNNLYFGLETGKNDFHNAILSGGLINGRYIFQVIFKLLSIQVSFLIYKWAWSSDFQQCDRLAL